MAVRHAFTVDEWHHMGSSGLFGDDARLELLDGEVIEMSPIGSRHASCVMRLVRMILSTAGDRCLVNPQNPVALDDWSEPQPDIAILVPRPDDYARSHPTPAEILLLVEVSDTTLAFDRDRKAPNYAKSGVPECWVVDLAGERILVMRSPSPGGYQESLELSAGDRVEIEALRGVSFDVGDILGSDLSP